MQSVKITLSTDNGFTYPIILANNTPNDGFETVTIPGITSAGARIKVEAVGNVFFDVSFAFLITGTNDSTPTISSFTPTSGVAGTQVTITGTNFITPSAVRFNGVAADFVVNSTTQIVATVPNGVTTGPITVTTPSGTATSAANFVVPSSLVVSGRIADAANNPITNVEVKFRKNFQGTITMSSTTTDAMGNYSSGDLGCQNNVLVTPSKVGLTFGPVQMAFTSTQCLTGTRTADFTGAPNGPNSFQFSGSPYTVNEGTLSVTVTITRTGDTSGTSTVDYTTTDADSFTVNCANFAGNAFARCDFSTSVDTLTFGPTETSKTFEIPIINDSWAEGTETFGVLLSNPTGGASLGSPSTAVITITDNETVNGPNPIFTTPFFVRQHYLDFLSREPEVGEPWTNVLNNCSDVNNNPVCDRLTVSESFFGSPEFRIKGNFVFRFYRVAFNRLPLYTEIVKDMRAVTGQTPSETFQKKGTFTNNFVLRPEFMGLYNAVSNATYVNTLMDRYGLPSVTTPNPATPNDDVNKVTLTRAQLIGGLDGATLTRAQVLRAIADSDQVFNLEFTKTFVAMQYYGYLQRTPEQAGFDDWLDYLTTHPGDNRTMVNGFMNSSEYRRRFGPVP